MLEVGFKKNTGSEGIGLPNSVACLE